MRLSLLRTKEQRVRYRNIARTWSTARLRVSIERVHESAKGIIYAEMLARRQGREKPLRESARNKAAQARRS